MIIPHRLKLLCLLLLFVPTSAVFGVCKAVDLYPSFKEYREVLMLNLSSVTQQATYFSSDWNRETLEKIQNTSDLKRLIEGFEAYVSAVSAGKVIRVVFSSKTKQITSNKANLVMVAFTEPVLRGVVGGAELHPTKVVVDYVCEENKWKIDMFNFDSRKSIRKNMKIEKAIDVFISNEEIIDGIWRDKIRSLAR